MLKNGLKMLMMGGAATALFAATPANAWYLYEFYDDYGNWVGSQVISDQGAFCQGNGTYTHNYTVTYYPGHGCP
jgi:hypothetical protein